MSRSMSSEREREYSELHAYLDFYATHVWKIDPSSTMHPSNVGKRIIEEHGRSIALRGLKQAVIDTVENLNHQPLEYIQHLDATLREHGIVTFSEIRRRYSSLYKRILKRGKIKNETEYYIIAGIIADIESAVSEEERNILENLVVQFEENA